MELLNVKPTKYETYDCHYNNLIAITKDCFCKDFTPIFWSSFDFNYTIKDPNNLLLDNISLMGYNNNRYEVLEKICGISLKKRIKQASEDISSFDKVISDEISNGNPVGVCINSYHLPWNEYYKKSYRRHHILACGIEDNTIYCCDGFLSDKINSMYIEDIFLSYENLLLYKNNEISEISLNKTLLYLKEFLLQNNANKHTDICNFADDILKCSFANDYQSKNISLSDFLFSLSAVAWCRINFIQGIKYVDNKYDVDVFRCVYMKIEEVYKNWLKVKMLVTKTILTSNDSFINKAKYVMYSIADKEEEIEDDIVRCCGK